MDTNTLRQKILDLAIRGKLVPQDPNDEPASVLLEKIRAEKQQMIKEGKIKAKDIKNDTIIFRGEDNLHYEKFQDGTVKCIEDEIPFQVPDGWEWCRLREIYNFIDYRGATPTKITAGVPLITAKNVKFGYIDYSIDDYISEEEYSERQQRGISHIGDILFTTEAPLGNAALADIKKYSTGQRLITFQHYGNHNYLVNNTMLMFILSDFFQHQLDISKTGSTVTGIKAAILKTLWIPIPPYNEQIRINEKINLSISLLDNISDDIGPLGDLITQAKNKILDLAIQGKLVPQNSDDEPASVLLERIRAEKEELIKAGKIKRDKKASIIYRGDDNSYYERIGDTITNIDSELLFEIPNSWSWCRLKTLADTVDNSFVDGPFGSNLKTIHYTQNKEVRIVQLNNIGTDGWKNVGEKYTTYEHSKTLERCKSYPGDIVIAKMMPAGRAIILPEVNSIYVISSDCVRIRLNNVFSKEYVVNMINSNTINKCVLSNVQGIGRTRTSLSKLKEILVPVPPKREQESIRKTIQTYYSILNVMAECL